MTANQTCGPMFHSVLRKGEKLAPMARSQAVFWFSLGHMTGQAEKVWMAACPAFMMRPGADELEPLIERVKIICQVYYLYWDTLETSRGTEVWVTKCEAARLNDGKPTGSRFPTDAIR